MNKRLITALALVATVALLVALAPLAEAARPPGPEPEQTLSSVGGSAPTGPNDCAAPSLDGYSGAGQLAQANGSVLAFAGPSAEPEAVLPAAEGLLLYEVSDPLTAEAVNLLTAALTDGNGDPKHPALRLTPKQLADALGADSNSVPNVVTFDVPIIAAPVTVRPDGTFDTISFGSSQGASDSVVSKTVATVGGTGAFTVGKGPSVSVGINGSRQYHNQEGNASTVSISQGGVADPNADLAGSAIGDLVADGTVEYVAVVTVTHDSAIQFVADPGRKLSFDGLIPKLEINWDGTGLLGGAEFFMSGTHSPQAGFDVHYLPRHQYEQLLVELGEHGVGINSGDFDKLQAVFFENAVSSSLEHGLSGTADSPALKDLQEAFLGGKKLNGDPIGNVLKNIADSSGGFGFNFGEPGYDFGGVFNLDNSYANQNSEWPLCDGTADVLTCAASFTGAPSLGALSLCAAAFETPNTQYWACVQWASGLAGAIVGAFTCNQVFDAPTVSAASIEACVTEAINQGISASEAPDVCELLTLDISGPGSGGGGAQGSDNPFDPDLGGWGDDDWYGTDPDSGDSGGSGGGGEGGFTVTCPGGWTFNAATLLEAINGCERA